jgi:hypothetical protein
MMRLFIAPVYTCSATAANWEVGESFDEVSGKVRRMARARDIFARSGLEVLGVPAPVQIKSSRTGSATPGTTGRRP